MGCVVGQLFGQLTGLGHVFTHQQDHRLANAVGNHAGTLTNPNRTTITVSLTHVTTVNRARRAQTRLDMCAVK